MGAGVQRYGNGWLRLCQTKYLKTADSSAESGQRQKMKAYLESKRKVVEDETNTCRLMPQLQLAGLTADTMKVLHPTKLPKILHKKFKITNEKFLQHEGSHY